MRNLHAYQFGCARRVRDFVPSAVYVITIFDLKENAFFVCRSYGRAVRREQVFVFNLGVTLSNRAVGEVAVSVIRIDLN